MGNIVCRTFVPTKINKMRNLNTTEKTTIAIATFVTFINIGAAINIFLSL